MIYKFKAEDIYFPQIKMWEEALDEYGIKQNLNFKKKAFYLAKFSEELNIDPYNIATVLIRIALSDLEGKLSKERKYVILQTYYDEGDLTTIDIVRLPLNTHKEIVKEYLEKILPNQISRQILPLDNGYSRFLTAGGFIKGNNNEIEFYGSSGDFSNEFSIFNVNDISSYLVKESDLFSEVKPKNYEKGKEYIEKCLDIMCKYKLTSEFYSQLVDFYLQNPKPLSHIFYSLILMKSIDKAIKENKDIIQIIIEETADGIGKEMVIKGLSKKILTDFNFP